MVSWVVLMSFVLGLALTSCDSAPTATPTFASRIRPSVTVLPIVPSEPPGFVGRSDPTQAALAAEGQPSQEANSFTPLPTEAVLPMQIFASDGRLLEIDYYRGSALTAPLIVLIHGTGESRAVWSDLASHLQSQGYHVVVPDFSEVIRANDPLTWTQIPNDVVAVVAGIFGLGTVASGTSVATVGVEHGATVAVNTCPILNTCRTAIVISPRPASDNPVDFATLSTRSLLIISADDDPIGATEAEGYNTRHTGEHLWQRFGSGGSGSELFRTQPQLAAQVMEWLMQHVPLPTS